MIFMGPMTPCRVSPIFGGGSGGGDGGGVMRVVTQGRAQVDPKSCSFLEQRETEEGSKICKTRGPQRTTDNAVPTKAARPYGFSSIGDTETFWRVTVHKYKHKLKSNRIPSL
jgi:hypothetical protein